MPSSENLDCYFENGLCGWTGENDWKIKSTVNNGIEKYLAKNSSARGILSLKL